MYLFYRNRRTYIASRFEFGCTLSIATFLFLMGLVISAPILVTPFQAYATAPTIELNQFRSREWRGAAIYNSETGNFVFCELYYPTQTTSKLSFAYYSSGDVSMYVRLNDSHSPNKNTRTVEVSIDNHDFGYWKLRPAGPNFNGIENLSSEMLEQLKRGERLQIKTIDTSYFFLLAGTKQAIEQLENCYNDSVGKVINPANPFSGGKSIADGKSKYETKFQFDEKGWTGSAIYKRIGGNFSYCQVESPEHKATKLMFFSSRKGQLVLSLINSSWKLPKNKHYSSSVIIDDRDFGLKQFKTATSTSILSSYLKPELVGWLKRGRRLWVAANNAKFSFSLRDSKRAIEQLEICAIKASGKPAIREHRRNSISQLSEAKENSKTATNPFALEKPASRRKRNARSTAKLSGRSNLEDERPSGMTMAELVTYSRWLQTIQRNYQMLMKQIELADRMDSLARDYRAGDINESTARRMLDDIDQTVYQAFIGIENELKETLSTKFETAGARSKSDLQRKAINTAKANMRDLILDSKIALTNILNGIDEDPLNIAKRSLSKRRTLIMMENNYIKLSQSGKKSHPQYWLTESYYTSNQTIIFLIKYFEAAITVVDLKKNPNITNALRMLEEMKDSIRKGRLATRSKISSIAIGIRKKAKKTKKEVLILPVFEKLSANYNESFDIELQIAEILNQTLKTVDEEGLDGINGAGLDAILLQLQLTSTERQRLGQLRTGLAGDIGLALK